MIDRAIDGKPSQEFLVLLDKNGAPLQASGRKTHKKQVSPDVFARLTTTTKIGASKAKTN